MNTPVAPPARTTVDAGAPVAALGAVEAGGLDETEVLARLQVGPGGLTAASAAERQATVGPNALRSHHARPLSGLGRQVRSPLLLLAAATVSFFVGERSDAVIIGAIVALSVSLGLLNEFRAERAVGALHAHLRHRAVVRRDRKWSGCDVTELVPGDLIRLDTGAIVPADVRLLRADALEPPVAIVLGSEIPRDEHRAVVARQRVTCLPILIGIERFYEQGDVLQRQRHRDVHRATLSRRSTSRQVDIS